MPNETEYHDENGPKNVQKLNLIFSDLVEIPKFGHFEICLKFRLKMLSNANKCLYLLYECLL